MISMHAIALTHTIVFQKVIFQDITTYLFLIIQENIHEMMQLSWNKNLRYENFNNTLEIIEITLKMTIITHF